MDQKEQPPPQCEKPPECALENRFTGAIVGAAIGDALGMPTEDINSDQFLKHFNGRVTRFENPLPDHPCHNLKAGQYTDDTQQLMILSESLIENRGMNVPDLSRRIAEWAYKCISEPGFNRYGGGTSINAGIRLYEGKQSVNEHRGFPTCGAAMRVAPVGLFFHANSDMRREAVRTSSQLTHNHEAAIEGAMLIADTLADIVNGSHPEQAVQRASKNLQTSLKENVFYMLNERIPPSRMAQKIGASASVFETVPMALSCFLYSPENFEQVVVEAANLVPGDTDSIACIAGALAGAYLGIEKIPSNFREHVEDAERLKRIGHELYLAHQVVHHEA